MKTLVTVSWTVTVAVDVDPEKMAKIRDNPNLCYREQIQTKAIAEAYKALQRGDGTVTDCEDFPQLAECAYLKMRKV